MHPKAGQHAYFSLLLVWIFWFFYNCCLNIPKQISASNSSIGLAKAGRRDWRKGKRKREKKEGCSGFLDLLPEVAECTWRIGKAGGSPSESLEGGRLLKLLHWEIGENDGRCFWKFGMVWNHSGKTCSSLVSFRLLPGSLVHFMYLKDHGILEKQAVIHRLLSGERGDLMDALWGLS